MHLVLDLSSIMQSPIRWPISITYRKPVFYSSKLSLTKSIALLAARTTALHPEFKSKNSTLKPCKTPGPSHATDKTANDGAFPPKKEKNDAHFDPYAFHLHSMLIMGQTSMQSSFLSPFPPDPNHPQTRRMPRHCAPVPERAYTPKMEISWRLQVEQKTKCLRCWAVMTMYCCCAPVSASCQLQKQTVDALMKSASPAS